MQDKTAVLGNTPGVEEDERYIEKRTELSQRITAKSWKYTLPRCEEPSSHMKGLIETVPLYIGPSALPRGLLFSSQFK